MVLDNVCSALNGTSCTRGNYNVITAVVDAHLRRSRTSLACTRVAVNTNKMYSINVFRRT